MKILQSLSCNVPKWYSENYPKELKSLVNKINMTWFYSEVLTSDQAWNDVNRAHSLLLPIFQLCVYAMFLRAIFEDDSLPKRDGNSEISNRVWLEMGRRFKETWALAKLNHLELRISCKIDADQTWKMKY